MSQTKSYRGVSRVLAKLEESVQAGKYYEAHQKYRTLYFRYLSQKRFDECLELLYTGAQTFLDNEQYGSGADLGSLVVDTLEKTTVADNELWMQRLGELIAKIKPTMVERETLLAKSVKWSSDISKTKMGHPVMHKAIAQLLWTEGNLEQARHHFLLSKDGSGCGQMLIQLSQTKGLPREIDLFIAQVVLQQLCLNEINSAMETFQTYTKYHPKISRTEPPFILPLLNFVYFLLKIIDCKKLAIFKKLCELYKPSLDRDPSYEKYLEKIGILFFGAPQQQQRAGGGIFGDLINQLFQGLDDGHTDDDDDDDDDDDEDSDSQASSTVRRVENDLD